MNSRKGIWVFVLIVMSKVVFANPEVYIFNQSYTGSLKILVYTVGAVI